MRVKDFVKTLPPTGVRLGLRLTSPSALAKLQSRVGVAVVLSFVLAGPASAIPSPDVMVNLFASTAQVLGVLSLLLGRWFVSRRQVGATSTSRGSYRTAFWIAFSLCAASSVGWYLYSTKVRDDRMARLQVNLNRDSREEGRKIVDVSLKELSFSDQLQRKDGVTTEELAKWVTSNEQHQIIDVRETEEREVGAIVNTRHVRFPDLLTEPEKYIDKSREVVLLCFNGNRSSELAEHFEGLGYDCRFMIGGYEKWLAEDRPLEMNGDYTRKSLREIPDYPNKDTLLDTPDVFDLIDSVNPLFVDVRYPGDFEINHLPGAVNITMRKLTSPELESALKALPKRPIIVPCYDKRSSFFALTIGLRLTRLGYTFLGRYTTPEGFAAPGKDKPHVAAWKAAHAPKSLLTLASEPLEVVLRWLDDRLGSLALAILALVLGLRLAISPLTIKCERDRRVQAALAPRVEELKLRYVDDPAAKARAMSRLFDEARLKPIFNLFATLVQLVLFTVFFAVVQRVAKDSRDWFLWIDEIGKSDASGALPLLVAALGGALVAIVASRRIARWLAPIAAIALGALVWNLSSALDLYLAASLVLVIAQNLGVGWWLARRASRSERRIRAVRARHASSSIVPLEHAHLVSGCGNKAVRLGLLIEAGLRVPRGFVVRADVLAARAANGRFSDAHRAAILSAHRELGATHVAVRSSGLNEDGADKSYAGVFESILDVTSDKLFDALDEVAASLSSARSGAYTNGATETGAVVVQAMVPARFAGVLFTEHPARSGVAALEMIEGLGDALVSGRAQPKTFELGRFSGRVLAGGKPPIDVAPLFALGRRVEALFGKPQDIEWAWADGRFHLLQARDITRLARQGDDATSLRERERARLLALTNGAGTDEVVFAQTELTELLPNPTPFSLAFMESLWSHGGSTDRACRSLGIPYDVAPDSPPFAVTAFGVLYVNQREQARRMQRAPSGLAAFRLSRAAANIERDWREGFLAPELRAARLRDALDLSKFSQTELVELFSERRRDFVTRSYARAEEINIAADFYMKSAILSLRKKGLDPAEALGSPPKTVVHEATELLARVGRGEADLAEFMSSFGHRAPKDYEFAEARYREAPEVARSLAARVAGTRAHTVVSPPEIGSRVLQLELRRARRYQALKEEAKHHALRDIDFLRRVLLELGARTGLGEFVFQLTPDEIERLGDPEFVRGARDLARARIEECEALANVMFGLEIRMADLEEKDLEHGGLIPRRDSGAALVGIRVAGSGDIVGRARVLRTAEEVDSFRAGEILIARFTDPTWMSVFPLAKGIVTEVGGWLSHAAIQAREYGITAVVGVPGVLDAFATGDLVRVRADGSIERLTERRNAQRVTRSIEVRVSRRSGDLSARIVDISTSGALVKLERDGLELGEELDVAVAGERYGARVARNGTPQQYGIAWNRAMRLDGISN